MAKRSKQFVGKSPTNCLSVFEHFVGLALKELRIVQAAVLKKLFLHKGTGDLAANAL